MRIYCHIQYIICVCSALIWCGHALGLLDTIRIKLTEEWPSSAVAPRVFIDFLMCDETSHKVHLPSSNPLWLRQMVHSPANQELHLLDEALAGDPIATDAVEAHPTECPAKKRRGRANATSTSNSTTWSVCVVRRMILWMTPAGSGSNHVSPRSCFDKVLETLI